MLRPLSSLRAAVGATLLGLATWLAVASPAGAVAVAPGPGPGSPASPPVSDGKVLVFGESGTFVVSPDRGPARSYPLPCGRVVAAAAGTGLWQCEDADERTVAVGLVDLASGAIRTLPFDTWRSMLDDRGGLGFGAMGRRRVVVAGGLSEQYLFDWRAGRVVLRQAAEGPAPRRTLQTPSMLDSRRLGGRTSTPYVTLRRRGARSVLVYHRGITTRTIGRGGCTGCAGWVVSGWRVAWVVRTETAGGERVAVEAVDVRTGRRTAASIAALPGGATADEAGVVVLAATPRRLAVGVLQAAGAVPPGYADTVLAWPV